MLSRFHWQLQDIPIVPKTQRVGQQGSEALDTVSNRCIYLYIFILLLWLWILRIVFFYYQNKYFPPIFSWGASWKKKHTLVDTSIFLVYFLYFQDQNEFLFYPKRLLQHFILKHASAFVAKRRQKLTNTRRSLKRKFSVLWNKKTDEKSLYPRKA